LSGTRILKERGSTEDLIIIEFGVVKVCILLDGSQEFIIEYLS